MKILLSHASHLGFGGIERHVIDLAEKLAISHEVAVLVDPYHTKRLPNGVKAYPVDMNKSRINPKLIWEFHKAIKEYAPDIIHAHGGKAASIIKKIKRLSPDLKTVVTVHGIKKNLSCYQGHNAIIAVSEAVKKAVRSQLATIITSGIREFSTIQTGIHPPETNGKTILIAVGRLSKVKGFNDLIAACEELSVNLWIIGEGDQRNALETEAKKRNVKLWLPGHRHDVGWLIKRADALVISSSREGGPYVLGEALLCKTPCVGYNVGNMNQVLPPEWMAPQGDIQALKKILIAATQMPENLFKDKETVFGRAKSIYSLSNMTEQTETLYKKVLSEAT